MQFDRLSALSPSIKDPLLFNFLSTIKIPDHDRYPIPATTHVPLSDEGETNWGGGVVIAEETFSRPSLTMAVCYHALANEIGYNYQALLAATKKELMSRCRNRMTNAQLLTLMAHLPLCGKSTYNTLSETNEDTEGKRRDDAAKKQSNLGVPAASPSVASRPSIVQPRRPLSAKMISTSMLVSHHTTDLPTSAREKRLQSIPEPTHVLVEEDGTPSYPPSFATNARRRNEYQMRGSADQEAAKFVSNGWIARTDAAGFLIPRPPPQPQSAPANMSMLTSRQPCDARCSNHPNELLLQTKDQTCGASASAALQGGGSGDVFPSQWPLHPSASATAAAAHIAQQRMALTGSACNTSTMIPHSTEALKRELERSAKATYHNRVAECVTDLQKTLEPFYSDATKSFSFKTARFKETLIGIGVAITHRREIRTETPSSSPSKKASRSQNDLIASLLQKSGRRGFRSAAPTIRVPSPPPIVVEELVVTYPTLVRLMDLCFFTAAERKHAQEVWAWEVVDIAMKPWREKLRNKQGRTRGGGISSRALSLSAGTRSPSPPFSQKAAGGDGLSPLLRRKLPFQKYGSKKYLAWLQSTRMLFEDFVEMLDSQKVKFLRTAFSSFATASSSWYWLKFNFPKPQPQPTPAPCAAVKADEQQGRGGKKVGSDEPFSTDNPPIVISTRSAVANQLFEDKRVEVLTFDDFSGLMHDNAIALTAFLGNAFAAIPSKAWMYEKGGSTNTDGVGEGHYSSEHHKLFGIHMTGRGASRAN